jgi:hypothetical protein
MPRTARACTRGYTYHVLDRATVFHKADDSEAFVEMMAEASVRIPIRILACGGSSDEDAGRIRTRAGRARPVPLPRSGAPTTRPQDRVAEFARKGGVATMQAGVLGHVAMGVAFRIGGGPEVMVCQDGTETTPRTGHLEDGPGGDLVPS